MTTHQIIEPLTPTVGLTQSELVDMGAMLRGQLGLSDEDVRTATQSLNKVANEAAFKGVAEVAKIVFKARLDEIARREQNTDLVLRRLLTVVTNMRPGFLGGIDRNVVIAAINGEIRKQEQMTGPKTIDGIAA